MQLDQFDAANVKPQFDFADQEPQPRRAVGRPFVHPVHPGETAVERKNRLRREQAAADREEMTRLVQNVPSLAALQKQIDDLTVQIDAAQQFAKTAVRQRVNLDKLLRAGIRLEQTSKQPL